MTRRHVVDLSFGTLTFYDWYVVSEPASGVDLGVDELEAIFAATEKHYRHPYCLISDRKNSFSVNPLAYKKILDGKSHIVSIAAVCYSSQVKIESAKTEIYMFRDSKPFAVFPDVEVATEWSKAKLMDAVVINHKRWL